MSSIARPEPNVRYPSGFGREWIELVTPDAADESVEDIREGQREEVKALVGKYGIDAARIAAELDLPAVCVKWRLQELGLLPKDPVKTVGKTRGRPPAAAQKIAALLEQNPKGLLVAEIVKGTGLADKTVYQALTRNHSRFARDTFSRRGKTVWKLRKEVVK